MEKIDVSSATIEQLFAGRNGIFIIPQYQRPYSWGEEQCADLWDDLNNFAFPNGRADDFNPDGEDYFLGNVVTYPRGKRSDEVVDGQQRITSLLLLMRALYDELRQTENGRQLGKCIWCFGEDGAPDMTRPRIISNATLDTKKVLVKQILTSGEPIKGDASCYSCNYRFFRSQISIFKTKTPDNLDKFASRMLRNVYFILEEAHSEQQALQVFLTGNDRGLPLRIEDIFKAKLYEHFKTTGGDEEANLFVDKWETLGNSCKKLFDNDKKLSQLEFVFLLYAIVQRENIDWKKLINIYSADDYVLLKSPQTLKNIGALLDFLATLHSTGNQLNVPSAISRKAYILFRCSKPTTWYLLTKYYFEYRDKTDNIFDERLNTFLERAIAFYLRSAILPDIFSITRPHNVLKAVPILFNGNIPDDLKISAVCIKRNLSHFYELKSTTRIRLIIMNWWTFRDETQPRIPWKTKLEIEHIFAKSRVVNCSFDNPGNVDLPGNLALLKSTDNRKANNFTFAEKHNVYINSHNVELKRMTETMTDFTEDDIIKRNQQIAAGIVELLGKTGFLQK